MAVATIANLDTTTTTTQPVRIPKLAVRNKTNDNGEGNARPATGTSGTTEGSSGENVVQTQSESSSPRASSPPGSGRRPSDQSGSGSSARTRRDVLGDQHLTGGAKGTVKKKKSGMLGFLTMKEPSAMALEQFAEAERKKAREKGNRANAATMSSRKLPEHVPKVNSKWDGLPDNAKRQSSEAKSTRSRGDSMATSTRRPSTQTNWSYGSGEGRRPIGSLSSRPPQSPPLAQRSSLQSRGTVSSTHSARAPIPDGNVHPAFRPIAVEETLENLPQTFLHPPSPPRQRQGMSPPRQLPRGGQQPVAHELPATFGPVPELDTPDGPLPELESELMLQEMDTVRSSNVTPVPKSPITPPTEDAYGTSYYSDSIASAYSSKDAHADAAATFFYSQSDTDHEDFARPSSPKHLRQPINFSRRRMGKTRPPSLGKLPETTSSGSAFLAQEQPIFSPTLKNSDGRIDPFLTDTFAAQSRATGQIMERQTAAAASSHQVTASTDVPVRASTSTNPSSTGVQSPVFSTAPTQDTRSPTATSDGTAADDGPDAYYTTTVRQNSDESITPSLASSTVSAQWNMTPKERLGLGGRIKKDEVSPWESDLRYHARDTSSRKLGSGGLASPTTESKLKRLSSRWAGKK